VTWVTGHRGLDRDTSFGKLSHQPPSKRIKAAGMKGAAIVGELPFHWQTDFDFSLFGGWIITKTVANGTI
jgi:hypothetical protein